MPFLERGYYITLLCMQHQKGHLSEETICFALGLRSVSEIPSVMSHFKMDDDGKYYQGRMEIETQKRREYTESRRENGKKGGRPKKEKEKPHEEPYGLAYENHMGNGNDNSNKGVVGGKKTPTFDHAHKAYKCATYLDAKVCDLMPNKKAADEVTLQKWADAFDKTNRINGYEWELIGEVLEFSQEDDFWKTNILSGDKFRKQFEQLYAKMRGKK